LEELILAYRDRWRIENSREIKRWIKKTITEKAQEEAKEKYWN